MYVKIKYTIRYCVFFYKTKNVINKNSQVKYSIRKLTCKFNIRRYFKIFKDLINMILIILNILTNRWPRIKNIKLKKFFS